MQEGNRTPGRYYPLSRFFREKCGGPVYKIPVDAGFSCPNRDGTVGLGGCSYCYNPAFSPSSVGINRQSLSVTEQIRRGKKKKGGVRYLAYFQAYTNTYGPLKRLQELYDEALQDPEVIGLSIATRPDCLSQGVLELLEEYARRFHVWVEYGLQTAHDATLARINRGHTAAQFAEAVDQTRGRGIFICAHVILGLPGETRGMMLKTMDFLNRCGVDGVKFHHLQVIRNTPLAEQYARGEITVFKTFDDYLPVLCDCLERLSPAIVIHRLAAQVTAGELLIAPRWPQSAGQIAAAVEEELERRGTRQGFYCHPPQPGGRYYCQRRP